MSDAVISVTFAGPLVTIQDAGRFGHLRFGVAASGPMDRLGFEVAQTALGNPSDASAIEVSLGGIVIKVKSGSLTCAVAGGGFAIDAAGTKHGPWCVLTLEPGMKLSLRGGAWGSWAYLAFAGDLVADAWLGRTATHSMSNFGGGAVTTGQTFTVRNAQVREDRLGDLPIPEFAKPTKDTRVVLGPQDQHFTSASVTAFFEAPYTLTGAFDRMGVRLDGPHLELDGALSIPSEPIVRGAVQVSGDGIPTVLLADHGTTGGYPKIATLITADQSQFAQKRAGEPVQFRAISPEDAVTATRQSFASKDAYLHEIRQPRGTLAQRLMRENLVSGVIAGDD